jgi:uncharacterized protein (DUF362 family)
MDKEELIITYGTAVAKMTQQVLEKADLASMIPKDAQIGIKPNLVVAKPHETGATTSPVMVAALIEYLQQHGHKNIVIFEGSWIGDDTKRAFHICGYEKISREYGVPLIDMKDDAYEKVQAGPIEMEIGKTALNMDFFISMPVLKGHCQTMVTGALKNMKGCLSDREKRHFHLLGLHKPIAYVNTILHPDFILVDGLCGDLDFEEGGNPVPMNRIFCGLDPVLVDSYIASTMGYAPEEIGYIKLAAQLGVGTSDLGAAKVTVLGNDHSLVQNLRSRKVKKLALCVQEKEACSACYANLIQALARLDDQNRLSYFKKHPICIGQGFKGKEGSMGSGSCTSGFDHHVPGCPPRTSDILNILTEELQQHNR